MPAGAGYDVFLSYSRADAAAADQLRTRLAAAGLRTFLDRYSLPGGKPWQPELETALGRCRALVVLLGPAGIGGWQHREIQLGLVRQADAERTPTRFPVIPVLLPNLQPDDVPLGTFLNLNTWVDLRPGLDEPEALQRLLAAAQGRAIDGLTSDLASLRPYRGLLPFREQDAGLYFGRQRFIDELTAKVRQRSATNVVAVLGRSGSGKSSIVFAGLFPALRQEKGSGQQAVWQILDLRPGAEPLHALIEAFDPPEPTLSRTQKLALINAGADLLRQRKVSLAQLVRDRLKDDPGTTRLLLYVDQWEELYTQAQKREIKTEDDRAHAADARLFVDLVLEAAATAPCTLVLSARSDFYADIQTHDALRAAVQDCQVSLGPMTAAELTAAIEGPARAVGARVEPELTRKLLRDIGLDLSGGRNDQYDIGKLPLLEYALEQAWTRATQMRIGPSHYVGLDHALEERANQIFDQLPEKQQAWAKRLFVGLVNPGEATDTRARMAITDEISIEVAEKFASTGARLVVIDIDAEGRRVAEVSHEALIGYWDRLRAWVDESRTKLKLRTEITAGRAMWLKYGRDASLLISAGIRLESARGLLKEPGDVPVEDISDYIKASIEAYEQFVEVEIRRAKSERWSAATTMAALIWSRLDSDEFLDSDELQAVRSAASIRAIWDLTVADNVVRAAFLNQLACNNYLLGKLVRRFAYISRAFGLFPVDAVLWRIIDLVLVAIAQVTDHAQLRLLVQAVQVVGTKLRPEHAQAALIPIVSVISRTNDCNRLTALAQAIQTVGAALSHEDAHSTLESIVETLRGSNDREHWEAMAPAVDTLSARLTLEQASATLTNLILDLDANRSISCRWTSERMLQVIQPLSARLTPEQAEAALSPSIDAIRRTSNHDMLRVQVKVVEILSARLTPEQAAIALNPILDTIAQATYPEPFYILTSAVKSLGTKLTPELVESALAPILDGFSQTLDRHRSQILAGLVALFGGFLTPVQAAAAFSPMLQVIRQSPIAAKLDALAPAIQNIAAKLTPEQAPCILDSILGAFHQTKNADQVLALAKSVHTLGAELSVEDAQTMLDYILDAVNETAVNEYGWDALARTIQLLRVKLSIEHSLSALESILDTIGRTTDSNRFDVLTDTLEVLADKLTPGQAQIALDPILDDIGNTADPEELNSLVVAVQIIGAKLPSEEARTPLDQILSTVCCCKLNWEIEGLLPAVQILADKLTGEDARSTLSRVLDTICKMVDPETSQLQTLAQAAQFLGAKLTPEQAYTAIGPFLAAICETAASDPDQLQALAQAAQPLGAKLTPEQAHTVIGPVLDALCQTTDLDRFLALAKVVESLGTRLTQVQAQGALGVVLKLIGRTTDSFELQALAKIVQILGSNPEQARGALSPVLEVIRRTTDHYELRNLAEAVQILGSTPKHAQAALGLVLSAVRQTTDYDQLRTLAQAVQTFGPKLSAEQAGFAIDVARKVLARTDEPRVAEAFARAIAVTLPADPAEPEPYVAAMVELLKWPTTVGSATDALLEVLHERVPGAPGKEAGLDATVAWVGATYPDIDLDSPPTFPASGSTGGAW